jgi:hypothetical protein
MRQLPVLFIALTLVGCAALVVGPYSASVSRADAEQLQQLATANPKIHFKKILYIHAVRPDQVYVEASDSILGSSIRCTFTLENVQENGSSKKTPSATMMKSSSQVNATQIDLTNR